MRVSGEDRDRRMRLNWYLGLSDFFRDHADAEIDDETLERRKRLNRDLGDIDDIIGVMNGIKKNKIFAPGPLESAVSLFEEDSDDPEIFDSGDSISITLGLPNAKPGEIGISVGKDRIYIKLARIGYAKEIELPLEVVHEGSRATYKNGVLDIVMMKAPGDTPKVPVNG